MSLADYMGCLFPTNISSNNNNNSSILNSLMHIDRPLAEKREFAALARGAASADSGTGSSSPRGEKKRLSWTGLGATATGSTMDGVVGLEMARKGCKDCHGHRGREVSLLVRYVCVPSQFGLETQLPGEGAK